MESLSSTEVRKHGTRVILRAMLSIVFLITLYYTLPLDGINGTPTILRLTGLLAVLVVAMAWQIRSIVRSPMPEFRAMEVVAITFPLMILIPASSYVLLSQVNTRAFSESLSRTDGLYFSITVFSTVGFGDISPVTQFARIAVSGQIFVNLILLGVGLRIVLGAVSMSKQRRRPAA